MSDALSADVVPAAGGRIVGLADRRSGREVLWTSPTRPQQAHPAGTRFDDVFAGGWDELVPNDLPGRRAGLDLPDHGELWTTPLEVVEHDSAAVTLRGTLPLTGLTVEKQVALSGDEIVVELRVGNPHAHPVVLQFRAHPALAISPGARLILPPVRARVPDPALSRAAADFQWPHATGRDGAPIRADIVPPPGPWSEWLVLPDGGRASGGWCGIVHEREDWSVTLAFEPEALPALWVFADYGGWQGSRFVLLEPATDADVGPPDAGGTLPSLAPNATLEISLRCRVGRADLLHRAAGATG